jgi:hypothetical protein
MKSNKIESSLTIANITSAFHHSNFTCQLTQANTTSPTATGNKALATYRLNIAFKILLTIAFLNKDM